MAVKQENEELKESTGSLPHEFDHFRIHFAGTNDNPRLVRLSKRPELTFKQLRSAIKRQLGSEGALTAFEFCLGGCGLFPNQEAWQVKGYLMGVVGGPSSDGTFQNPYPVTLKEV